MSTYMHTGANTGTTSRHAIPRRLDPRRTARFMGIRVRPATSRTLRDVAVIGTGGISLAGLMDFDSDPTVWYPSMIRVLDTIATHVFA